MRLHQQSIEALYSIRGVVKSQYGRPPLPGGKRFLQARLLMPRQVMTRRLPTGQQRDILVLDRVPQLARVLGYMAKTNTYSLNVLTRSVDHF